MLKTLYHALIKSKLTLFLNFKKYGHSAPQWSKIIHRWQDLVLPECSIDHEVNVFRICDSLRIDTERLNLKRIATLISHIQQIYLFFLSQVHNHNTRQIKQHFFVRGLMLHAVKFILV